MNSNQTRRTIFAAAAAIVAAIHNCAALGTAPEISTQSSPIQWSEAQWIWQADDGPANSWLAFRKTFDLADAPATAAAQIATDTKYWLWVNGELAVFEGGLARGPSPGNGYYDELDLQPFLHSGTNTIAILVWYWGKTAKTHEDSGKGGLLFAADLGETVVVSDRSWKVKVHPAYDPASKGLDRSANRANAMDVKFDARKALGDWSGDAWYLPHYIDETWSHPEEKGEACSGPWGDLVKRPIPQWVDHGLADFESLKAGEETVTLPYTNTGNETVVLRGKLPFNQQITPYLKVKSEAGITIEIGMDNPFNLIEAQYTTNAGIQAFETYSWMNGHVVEYSIPAGVEVLELKYRWTALGSITGAFQTSDPFLDRLWWMAANTLQVCARDSYMDCPDRERGLWVGDVADQTGAVFYALNEPGRLLLKKAIDNTFAYQSGDIIQGLAPGFGEYRGQSSELCAQSLQYIEYGIWQYYFNTGDRETLAYAYPYVLRYLKLWQMGPEGLPEERRGYATWIDWGLNPDKTPTHIAWYYMALKTAKGMAMELGIQDDLAWYDTRIESIAGNFQKVYWRDGYFGTEGKPKEERVSALAILTGLADEDQYEAILQNVLIPEYNASPHMEWIVEEAIMHAGNYAAGLERMKNRHESQVSDTALTTLYERFENDEKGRGTYNHAWNAPNYVLSRYIAGIAADEVAWKRYHVLPNLAHLTAVKQVVPSVQGDITVDIELADESYSMQLISPEGTIATVGIPKASISPQTVQANGKTIWINGVFQKGVSGIKWKGEDKKYLLFEVAPGNWSFLASTAGPKNVLVFFIDDLRPELGCYGKAYVQSPHIDTLASQGILFERAYCQQALCGPSRISMMAGTYPDTLGIQDLWSPLRRTIPDAMSLPRYFRERGYFTGSYGKVYHHHTDDTAFWSDLPDKPGQKYADAETVAAIQSRQDVARERGASELEIFSAARGPATESAEVADDVYQDGAVAAQAIESIRRNRDHPFFICVGFAKPHLPFAAPKRYWDLYQREQFVPPARDLPAGAPALAFTNWGELRAYAGIPEEGPLNDAKTSELMHGYAACVSFADAQVGKVMAELDRLGLREDTIVVFWGDHGYKIGDYGLWCKHTNLELDTRVPFIVSAPGYPQGGHSPALVEMVDIFPTLARLTGGAVPESCAGNSLEPVLKDPDTPLRSFALSQYPRGKTIGYSIRTDRWRYTEWINTETMEVSARELYDHAATSTPDENLASDPVHTTLINSLSAQLDSGSRIRNIADAGEK